MHEDLPLARFAALRLDERRRQPDLIAQLAATDSTRVVLIRGDAVALEPATSPPTEGVYGTGRVGGAGRVGAVDRVGGAGRVDGPDGVGGVGGTGGAGRVGGTGGAGRVGGPDGPDGVGRAGGADRSDQPDRPGLARLTAGELRSSGLLAPPTVLVDLGRAGSVDYLGALLPSSPPNSTGDPALLTPKPVTEVIGARQVRWAGLRDVGADLTDLDAGLATAGIALAAWHARAGFCPQCGASTEVTAAGWVRTCLREATELFPRTDPAVIMAVTDSDDRLLLGNSAAWHSNRFSLIAGFVEAGESAEAAVRREVWEETRVEVGAVRYLASQPWPFPGSLMMAFEAEARTTSITVDGAELAQARWFSRPELAQAVETGQIRLAMRASIARVVIERWYGAAFPLP